MTDKISVFSNNLLLTSPYFTVFKGRLQCEVAKPESIYKFGLNWFNLLMNSVDYVQFGFNNTYGYLSITEIIVSLQELN